MFRPASPPPARGHIYRSALRSPTELNGTLVSEIVIDTTQVATDTIDHRRKAPVRAPTIIG